MKKTIFLSVLILAIIGSVLGGTLATYTIKLDNFASGDVVAKEFIFLKDGEDTFQQNVKIAPTETVIWQLGVKNHDGSKITETDLYYKLVFNVHAATGRSAILPLIVTVKDSTGAVVSTVTGVGTMEVLGAFPLSTSPQRAGYTIEIHWPSNTDVDINYAGDAFGTAISVSALASQLPIDGGNPGENPGGGDPGENPGENPGGDHWISQNVAVKYETNTPWQNGESGPWHYEFRITITNSSATETINGWSLGFVLPDSIYSYWNMNKVSGSQSEPYVFTNPQSYYITIDPGQSLVVGGLAYGNTAENPPITSVTINGQPVSTSHTRHVDLND